MRLHGAHRRMANSIKIIPTDETRREPCIKLGGTRHVIGLTYYGRIMQKRNSRMLGRDGNMAPLRKRSTSLSTKINDFRVKASKESQKRMMDFHHDSIIEICSGG